MFEIKFVDFCAVYILCCVQIVCPLSLCFNCVNFNSGLGNEAVSIARCSRELNLCTTKFHRSLCSSFGVKHAYIWIYTALSLYIKVLTIKL